MTDKAKRSGWANVYGWGHNRWIGELYDTKAEARENTLDLPEHIATVKIEWEE